MTYEISTAIGTISISHDVIGTIVGMNVMECMGVLGMVSTKKVKDGVMELLKKENYNKGVLIHENDNDLEIDIYIIVSYGVKISEVAQNIQEKVAYSLLHILSLEPQKINVLIQDVKVMN